MADTGNRPSTLMFVALGIVGWALAAYLWSQVGQMRDQMTMSLKSAEMARSGLAADFQNLQAANGDLSAIKRKVDAAQAELAAASKAAAAATARADAENQIAKEAAAKVTALQSDLFTTAAAIDAKNKELQDAEARRAVGVADAAASATQAQTAAEALKVLLAKIDAAKSDLAELNAKIEKGNAAQSAPAQ